MEQADHPVYNYLRPNKRFPTVWCPGCGIGTVAGAMVRAIDRLGWHKDEVALVSGIGCSGRMSVYLDFNTLHTTHGRALAFATGLKLAKPAMHIITVMGDGDALAIGGNHFIHACRRNIGITAIVINNSIYGMTGGQVSPTTPSGATATTAMYGCIDPPFQACDLAKAAGASFVARATVYHTTELTSILAKALSKNGLSVVEVISQCPVQFGRLNKKGTAADMLRAQRDGTIGADAAARLSPEELAGKLVRGILVDRDAPEYSQMYAEVIAKARGQ
jgi:2-oxoglutarate ferredoxin oxidoreductase subunit beta